jgi:hypothetical protein
VHPVPGPDGEDETLAACRLGEVAWWEEQLELQVLAHPQPPSRTEQMLVLVLAYIVECVRPNSNARYGKVQFLWPLTLAPLPRMEEPPWMKQEEDHAPLPCHWEGQVALALDAAGLGQRRPWALP